VAVMGGKFGEIMFPAVWEVPVLDADTDVATDDPLELVFMLYVPDADPPP